MYFVVMNCMLFEDDCYYVKGRTSVCYHCEETILNAWRMVDQDGDLCDSCNEELEMNGCTCGRCWYYEDCLCKNGILFEYCEICKSNYKLEDHGRVCNSCNESMHCYECFFMCK